MEFVVTDRMLERAVYWVIIILLGTLLVLTYFKGGDCDATATANTTAPVTQPTTTTTPVVNTTPTPVAETPRATCLDGIKNQDESDVDCGGTICKLCADTKKCVVAADCTSAKCDAGVCGTKLSGQISFSVGAITTASGGKKLNSLTATVTNGESEPLELTMEVFVKTSNDAHYINQRADAEETGEYIPYAEATLLPLGSGKTVTDTYNVTGPYFFDTNSFYSTGEDVLVEVNLKNKKTGGTVATLKKSVKI